MSYICLCQAISEDELKDYQKQNPTKTEKQIIDALGISKGCGTCESTCVVAIKNDKCMSIYEGEEHET